jgi:hypothetical protein
LDEVWHETQIFIDPLRVFDQKFCIQNAHFLLNKLDKPIFHKNLDKKISMYPYIYISNMLFIDDMPYNSLFNKPFGAIFFGFFLWCSWGGPLFVGTTTNHDFLIGNFGQKIPLLDISKKNHSIILVKWWII